MEYLSKSDVVAMGVRDLIERGDLAPGEVLRQRDLAKLFNVSPTPVREALRKLEAEGFVATELHRGATVVRTQDARLFENFLIRANLESLAAGLAAEKMTEEDIGEIDQILEKMEGCQPGTPAESGLNREFHFRIYEGARSPMLLALLNLLWRSLDGGPRVARPEQESLKQHRAIADALRKHDPEEAAEITRMHIMEHAEIVTTAQDK